MVVVLQDQGTKLARRIWSSIKVSTEIYVTDKVETAERTVSDFVVVIPVENKD